MSLPRVHSAAKSWAGSRARARQRKESQGPAREGVAKAFPAKGSLWAWLRAAGLWESGVLGSQLASPPAMSKAGWPSSSETGQSS